jgi:hypothetical protein
MEEHADHSVSKDVLRETLAGYAAANEVIEQERAERLARLTPEEALEMARDLEASWEASAAAHEGIDRLESWRLETKLKVRRAFEAMARTRGLL